MKPSRDFRLCLAAILPMVLTLPLVATSGVPRPLASLSLATSFLLWALSGMPEDTQRSRLRTNYSFMWFLKIF